MKEVGVKKSKSKLKLIHFLKYNFKFELEFL